MGAFTNGPGVSYQAQTGMPAPFERTQELTKPLEKYGWWDVFNLQSDIDRDSTSAQSFIGNWFADQNQSRPFRGRDLNKQYGTQFGDDDMVSNQSLQRALELQSKQRFLEQMASTVDNAGTARFSGGIWGSSSTPLDFALNFIPYGKVAGLAAGAARATGAATKVAAISRATNIGANALEFGFQGRGILGGARRGILEGGISGAGMSAIMASQGQQFTGQQFTWQDAALNTMGGALLGGVFGGIGGTLEARYGNKTARRSAPPGALEADVESRVINGEPPIGRDAQKAWFDAQQKALNVEKEMVATGSLPLDLESSPLRDFSSPYDNVLYNAARNAGDPGTPPWLSMADDAQTDIAEAAIVAARGDHVQADMAFREGFGKLEALVTAAGEPGELVTASLEHIRTAAPKLADALEKLIAPLKDELPADRVTRITSLREGITAKTEGPKGLGAKLEALSNRAAKTMSELLDLEARHAEAKAAGRSTTKLDQSIAARQKKLAEFMEAGRPLLLEKTELDMQATMLQHWLEGQDIDVAPSTSKSALATALSWADWAQDHSPETLIKRITDRARKSMRLQENIDPETGAWKDPHAEKTELGKMRRVRTPLTNQEWLELRQTHLKETLDLLNQGLIKHLFDEPLGFKTAKGSAYKLEGAGTSRFKAATGENFKSSDKTVFVDPETQQRLMEELQANNIGDRKASIRTVGDELALVVKDRKTGKVINEASKRFKYTEYPDVGRHPVEVWDKNAKGEYGFHMGNAITEVEYPPLVQTLEDLKAQMDQLPKDKTALEQGLTDAAACVLGG